MKTAISIPDQVFRAAEKIAGRLGLSRSELYSRAVAQYLSEHDDDEVTEALDRLYATTDSRLEADVVDLETRALPGDEW